MADGHWNILILCTGNSARSILGEMLIGRIGQGRMTGFSAGSTPTGRVNPYAVRLLAEKGYDTAVLRSKTWDEFSGADAPRIDFVFTVCDNAAGEVCPVWPGHPLQAHWGIPDPAAATGSDDDIMRAFELAYAQLERRITAFAALKLEQLPPEQLQKELTTIGQSCTEEDRL